jgi:hypothetical protein
LLFLLFFALVVVADALAAGALLAVADVFAVASSAVLLFRLFFAPEAASADPLAAEPLVDAEAPVLSPAVDLLFLLFFEVSEVDELVDPPALSDVAAESSVDFFFLDFFFAAELVVELLVAFAFWSAVFCACTAHGRIALARNAASASDKMLHRGVCFIKFSLHFVFPHQRRHRFMNAAS